MKRRYKLNDSEKISKIINISSVDKHNRMFVRGEYYIRRATYEI